MVVVLLLAGLFIPRIVLLLSWMFGLFNSVPSACFLVPILGFLFFPLATLAYCFAFVISGSIGAGWVLLIILGFLIDCGGISVTTHKVKDVF